MKLCFSVLLFWPLSLMAQVANDDINERSILVLDADPVVSNTDHNTVEWACINKKLTEKCLVYHNDQWFSFQVEKAGNYFINIASQKCKDQLGVQLIVIEGNPCEVNTYRIMECIRRIDQGVKYVELKNLQANKSYLVNVDGFQGDFCEFKIQLSSTPWKPSKVLTSADSLELKARTRGRVVELFWELKNDTEKSVSGFTVYRHRDGDEKKQMTREVSTSLNALGVNATKYTVPDTLPGPGKYKFEIFGLLADTTSILLAEHRITWDGVNFKASPPPPPKTIATFTVTGRPGAKIELVLLDDENPARLWTHKLIYDPVRHATMQLDLEPWLKQGKRGFLVIVIDEEKREPVEYYFTTDRSGNVIRD